MAALFWTLLSLYPFVIYCQSGDDGESIDTDCWSYMTIKETSLLCVLNENDLDICENFATLCPLQKDKDSVCANATLKNNSFTFCNLSPVSSYKLDIHLKGGGHQIQNIDLVKIVNISAPEIENATYKIDEAVIHIRYTHDYVKTPDFQVQFWGQHSKIKQNVTVKYQEMRIGGDKLSDSEIYHVRVRARPVDYFAGSWTEWSKEKRFTVNHTTIKDISSFMSILLSFSTIVVAVIVILILRKKKEILACIFPEVPDPKATLVQIHKQKDHFPVSFSPEIFKDINIYPVVYSEEKQLSSEIADENDRLVTTKSCDDDFVASKSLCEKQDKDDQSHDLKTLHLTVKLLDESVEYVRDNSGCQNVAAPQRHSNDVSYVTMSSLYKTQ